MRKIKWRGCNTAQNIWWNKKADSYKELWDLLLIRNLVCDEDYVEYLFNKYKVAECDFYDTDGEWLEDKYNEFMNKHWLEEDEYKELIKSCDGNAYYQWFWEWNEELSDYVEV